MSEPTLAPSATYLADYMERYLGIPLQVELPKSGKSRKKLSSAVETILSKPGDQPCIILKNQKNGETPGGYQLEITPVGGVRIEGNDEAGVFYGVQTLIQLLPTRAGVLPILPTLKIIDYPRTISPSFDVLTSSSIMSIWFSIANVTALTEFSGASFQYPRWAHICT